MCGTAAWNGRAWSGSISDPNPMAVTESDLRSGGEKFREIAEEMCGKGVELRVNNRFGGFKALREKWHTHISATLCRPVLLVDEAQEMLPSVLSELRLLASFRFDSQVLLTTILAGDMRLLEKL